jgi:AcrR family transcriptional regulator
VAQARKHRWGNTLPEGAEHARELLLDAAERCFERWGPAKTSLDDIAAEAHVSRVTVYRYLGSRADLFIALAIRKLHRASDQKLGRDQPAALALADFLLLGRDFVQSYAEPGLIDILASSSELTQHSREGYLEWLDEMKARGEVRDDLDVEDAVDWVLWIRTAVWLDNTTDRDHLAHLLTTYFAPTVTKPAPVSASVPRKRAVKASRPA